MTKPVLVADEKAAAKALRMAFLAMHKQPPEDSILEHMVGVVLTAAYPEAVVAEAVGQVYVREYEVGLWCAMLDREVDGIPEPIGYSRVAILKEPKP